MSSLAGRSTLIANLCRRCKLYTITASYLLSSSDRFKRQLSTASESTQPELVGENAYDLLGVSETSSFAEIKSSFRKLAKETHPDLAKSHNSHRFVQILAAYEILSDCQKRADYDKYLLDQKVRIRKSSGQPSVMYTYELNRSVTNQMDCVEWLRWYRYALQDILLEKRLVTGSGYLDELERDFYSGIHAAYYGPLVESMDLLPDCFEAEERSSFGTPEVLHLVSGRDLFGIIRLAGKVPELSSFYHKKLPSYYQTLGDTNMETESLKADSSFCRIKSNNIDYSESDSYRDLELHLSGKVVAVATRVPPKSNFNGKINDDSEDHIHVFLNLHEDLAYDEEFSAESVDVPVDSRVPLGRISGLGTSSDEDSCFVYDCNGVKTHVIMKHRTLLVKHMHWYEVGDKVSVCECRCSRARLPPSRYWLFEPRCGMHDIGGWYIETYGKDRKGRTIPSKRFWDGFDTEEHFDKRLHPAMYLLSLAYRTLDLEDAKRRKQHKRNLIQGKLYGLISWCKKLYNGVLA